MTATVPAPTTESQPAPPPPPLQRQPLWPQPIEVLGLTGEYASGKTLFGLSISPGPTTLVYDTEKSAGTYQSLGFVRVDLTAEMLRRFPGGYKPVDLFTLWRDHVRSIRPGQFRVIVLDTVSEIETGIVEYVRRNPQEFGYTASQFASAAALMWGAVKDFWKSLLSDLAARCETFAFTSHLRSEFEGGRPTTRRIPKGKETLMELASLYLHLERLADKKGNVPDIPSAVVLKSRLATISVNDSRVETKPTLPPRLPLATPAAIRAYMLAPPDYAKLKVGERLQEHETSVEDMERLRLARAEVEAEVERLKLERQQQAQRAAARVAPQPTPQPIVQPGASAAPQPQNRPPAPTPVAAGPSQPLAKTDGPPAARETNGKGPHPDQLDAILGLVNQLCETGMPRENYKSHILAKRGVTSARELTPAQADDLIGSMRRVLTAALTARGSAEVSSPGN